MDELDKMRIRYGFWVILGGFVLVGGIAAGAMLMMKDAQKITVMVGSVTGLVGTVVGAYLGVQVGSAGRERSEAARQHAENMATKMALRMDKVEMHEVHEIMNENEQKGG